MGFELALLSRLSIVQREGVIVLSLWNLFRKVKVHMTCHLFRQYQYQYS